MVGGENASATNRLDTSAPCVADAIRRYATRSAPFMTVACSLICYRQLVKALRERRQRVLV